MALCLANDSCDVVYLALDTKRTRINRYRSYGWSWKKSLMFMESVHQQLGGGAWLDMRAQMRSLDQSTNNDHSHTNSS